jgi:sugar phosphate isomerase/epimerase
MPVCAGPTSIGYVALYIRFTCEKSKRKNDCVRLIQITDLHLSDRTDTPAAAALQWAIAEANRLVPDLVAVTGDITTYGTATAAGNFLAATAALEVPWVFTPGNAELRDPGAMPILGQCMSSKSVYIGDVQFLLPDTSTGRLSEQERNWLAAESQSGVRGRVILTHYPIDVLDQDSRRWIEAWLQEWPVEMYLAGHRHFDRSRRMGDSQEITTRGLDPEKAFGGPAGISLLERDAKGQWALEQIPWPHEQSLLPADVDHSPVGWSIHGDPLETVRETRDAGLSVLELRPREPRYDLPATVRDLQALRDDRPIYLSWHLPNLVWDEETGRVAGAEEVARQIDDGRACATDSFTVHVPKINAAAMFDTAGEPSAAWDSFLSCYEGLFRDVVAAGIRVSIENIHNQPGTPADRPNRGFATEIGEYLAWIDSVEGRIGHEAGRIGAHFDVGHARNNGDLGNLQPIGDWYARVGKRITGYHIHQVRPHEETGKLTNHRDILSVYDRTVSYAGFLHAWSQRQINREPLFIEVRIAEERRRTVKLFEELFAAA